MDSSKFGFCQQLKWISKGIVVEYRKTYDGKALCAFSEIDAETKTSVFKKELIEFSDLETIKKEGE